MKSIVFIRRTESKYAGNPVIDIPESDLAMTLKLHPHWEVLNLRKEEEIKEVEQAPSSDKMECPLCGDKFSTEKGLKTHKLKKHS